MALRALVYSKNPLTAGTLAPVLKGLNIEAEVCADALAAIEKGTKQAFSCVIVDWSDQPEAAFLLRRTRESTFNPNVKAIAIVDREPTAVQIRDHRLDFLLFRPISVGEAATVLAKACQGTQVPAQIASPVPAAAPVLESEAEPQFQSPLDFEVEKAAPKREDPDLVSLTAPLPKPQPKLPEAEYVPEPPDGEGVVEEPNLEMFASGPSERSFSFRAAAAVVLVLAAAFCVWRASGAIKYLSHTPEGAFNVLRESVASFFFTGKSATSAVPSGSDSQQDAFFARSNGTTSGRSSVGVVSTEPTVPDALVNLHRAFDFPLPTLAYTQPEPPAVHVRNPQVPDSLKTALPIGPPVIATGPAQIMPVSTPAPPVPQFSEPVRLPEETVRTMLVHSVEPAYPREAAAQKLQGPVVLDALIGRDGSVEDLKIVRGYFVLSRAAIAAVKQWRFKPYINNGHAAQVQTTITVDFGRPQS